MEKKHMIIIGIVLIIGLVVSLAVFLARGTTDPETDPETEPGTYPDNSGTDPDNSGTDPDNSGTDPDEPTYTLNELLNMDTGRLRPVTEFNDATFVSGGVSYNSQTNIITAPNNGSLKSIYTRDKLITELDKYNYVIEFQERLIYIQAATEVGFRNIVNSANQYTQAINNAISASVRIRGNDNAIRYTVADNGNVNDIDPSYNPPRFSSIANNTNFVRFVRFILYNSKLYIYARNIHSDSWILVGGSPFEFNHPEESFHLGVFDGEPPNSQISVSPRMFRSKRNDQDGSDES